jgi:phosphoserine phosphatase
VHALLAQSARIATGDGAKPLEMMGAVGLSVAYRAKPRVREQAKVAIDMGGLDRLLELFGAD